MSGGSMGYLYSKIDCEANFHRNTPQRKAFAAHLVKVTKALHDIEWVDSCDYTAGDENEAIMACIERSDVVEAAVESARAVMAELADAIKAAEGAK